MKKLHVLVLELGAAAVGAGLHTALASLLFEGNGIPGLARPSFWLVPFVVLGAMAVLTLLRGHAGPSRSFLVWSLALAILGSIAFIAGFTWLTYRYPPGSADPELRLKGLWMTDVCEQYLRKHPDATLAEVVEAFGGYLKFDRLFTPASQNAAAFVLQALAACASFVWALTFASVRGAWMNEGGKQATSANVPVSEPLVAAPLSVTPRALDAARPAPPSATPRALDAARPAPRVFFSYSHDDEEHSRLVLELAQELRSKDHVDVWIDQFEERVDDWPLWMQRQIEQAEVVVAICSPRYRDLFDKKLDPAGHGLGAIWEGLLTRLSIYVSGSNASKFIALLMVGHTVDEVPLLLRGNVFEWPRDRQRVLRYLRSEAVTPAPLPSSAPERDGPPDA